MVVEIGIAAVRPAEFIVLRFSQDTRALEEELAGAA
jgi:phage tail sheath protein FI